MGPLHIPPLVTAKWCFSRRNNRVKRGVSGCSDCNQTKEEVGGSGREASRVDEEGVRLMGGDIYGGAGGEKVEGE